MHWHTWTYDNSNWKILECWFIQNVLVQHKIDKNRIIVKKFYGKLLKIYMVNVLNYMHNHLRVEIFYPNRDVV